MSQANGATGDVTVSIPDVLFGTHGLDALSCALKYAAAGIYVGPVAPGTKHPGSILGGKWHHQTSRDPQVIAEWYISRPAGQTPGVFLHVGRSDLVVFDLDHPESIPLPLLAAILSERPPVQTTRGGDVVGASLPRGHYLFRVPAGRILGNGRGQLGAGWGDVRGVNGVIIVSPSVHPEGGEYRWQSTGVVPMLPESVANLLPNGSPAEDAATDATVRARMGQWVGSAEPGALRAVQRLWANEMTLGGSRHELAVKAACWVARDAACGLYPLAEGMRWLGDEFVDVLGIGGGGGRILSAPRARAEFAGIVAWAVGQAMAEPPEALEQRRVRAVASGTELRARAAERAGTPSLGGLELPGMLPTSDPVPGQPAGPPAPPAGGGAAPFADPPGDPNEGGSLDTRRRLPAEFWEARPALAHIRQAAYARGVGPDVVFAACLARVAAMVPPHVRIDVGFGPASLNYYTAAIGYSGDGKSLSVNVANDLVERPAAFTGDREDQFRDGVPLGSGEGMAEQFMGTVWKDSPTEMKQDGTPKKVPTRQVVRHNAEFYVDEGEGLVQMMTRSGATIGTVIRSAWGGETLGQANAGKETTRIVPRGAYSLGLVVGFQPGKIEGLFDATGGTPQRFTYLWVADPSIPEESPAWPGMLPQVGDALSALHEPSAPFAPPVDSVGPLALGVAPPFPNAQTVAGGLEAAADAGPAAGELDNGAGPVGPQNPGAGSGVLHSGAGQPGAQVEPVSAIGVVAWRLLGVDPAISAAARRERYLKATGQLVLPELEAHRPLHMMKAAGLLALLDGRTDVTWDDWQLAEVLWSCSCDVRDWLVSSAEAARKLEADQRRDSKVTTEVAADAAKERAAVERLARKVAAWVRSQEGASALVSDAHRARASKDRGQFREALDVACAAGWLTVELVAGDGTGRVAERVRALEPAAGR